MNIKFSDRELKHDELDKQEAKSLETCLVVVCLVAPRVWAQFKTIVAKVEKLAEREKNARGYRR